MKILLNGEKTEIEGSPSLLDLLIARKVHPEAVVVEQNGKIINRSALGTLVLEEGDGIEIVHFVGGGAADPFIISNISFSSRLLIGTGKFSSGEKMREAVEASGAQLVTVAMRRVDFNSRDPNILSFLDFTKYRFLPNTSGARTAEEAVRVARLCRAATNETFIKLEVTPEPRYLLPDGQETLKATEILVREGFVVLPYMQADPILAKQLEEAGAATVMPLGSPIGSNQGLRTRDSIRIIIEQSKVPVVVDAGLGAPSHAAEAMEMGADAVLINTAIAIAKDPVSMAFAFSMAVKAGRAAFLAGLGRESHFAEASSPLSRILGSGS